MDKLAFFDLLFAENDVRMVQRKATKYRAAEISEETVEDEFFKFFYRNNLTPLFTDEHRTDPIPVGLINAQELLKSGSRPNRLLKDFANWVSLGQDNKSYERTMFKILHASRDWKGFLNQIQQHLDYLPYIEEGYKHNTWNIVFYDKDKSGTKVSRGI